MRILLASLLIALLAPFCISQTPTTHPTPPSRFTWVDVYVDSGNKPLAAYQVEFKTDSDSAKLVGVEGGDPPAFTKAPYYDPAALSHNRVIVAAFSTARELPAGKVRVARLHLCIEGGGKVSYTVRLIVAASVDGKPIDATTSLKEGDSK